MARIPQACAPVNARTIYEATLDEALHTLCQAISERLNALLVVIVCCVVGRHPWVKLKGVAFWSTI